MFGGGSGSNFNADPITQLTNPNQISQTYNNSQDALGAQKAFLAALQGQNGIANQSQVYGNLSDVAAGRGPNPAKAMLDQATGANAAQTAALIGSGRGVSANPGMAARVAANAGAGIQQNAVGQGATLQANQSLGALGQMGQIAGQQVGQLGGATAGLNQFAQGEQGQVLGAGAAQNTATNQRSGVNEDIAKGNQKAQQGLLGGLASGIGAVTGLHFAGGGQIISGPRSGLGRHVAMAKGGVVPAKVSPGEIYLSPDKARAVAAGRASPLSGERIKGKAKVGGDSYSNDTVKKNLKQGGVVVPRSKALGDDVTEKATAFVRAVLAKGRYA